MTGANVAIRERRDDAPTLSPGLAVADEEAVTEQREQRVAHLRGLALEAVMHGDEGLRDGVGAVADEHPAVQHTCRKELVLEGLFFPDRQVIAPRGGEQCQWRQCPGRPRRKRRHERVDRGCGRGLKHGRKLGS
jgi:hypothetical protein